MVWTRALLVLSACEWDLRCAGLRGSPPRALDARLARRLWRGARAGLAALSATSGFRHFILPPMRAAQLSAFYKRASGRPANTH